MSFTAGTLVIPFISAKATTNAAVSLSASTPTVAPGAQVTLTAGMPVSDAGTVTQEIVQTIDPTKVKLTSVDDITYPAGWTLSFSTDGTTFTTTTPTTLVGWAAVRAVKAAGSIVSEGASGTGKQIATRTSSGVAFASGSIPSGGASGDGWDVFFDPAYKRVFNRWHHDFSIKIDCHWLKTEDGHTAGASCWPDGSGVTGGVYYLPQNNSLYRSSNRSTGWIDSRNRLWLETNRTVSSMGFGFACIDVNGTRPTPCAEGEWFPLYTPAVAVNSYNAVMDIAAVDGKVFTHSARSDGIHVMCLDTLAVGGPAPCPGQPYSIADGQFFNDSDDHMMAIAGKIYSLRSNGASRSMWCIDPALIATGASSASVGCAGWATNPVSVTGWGPIIAAPNSSGSLVAACTLGTSTCLNLQDGTSVVSGLPSNLKTNLNSFGVGSLNQHATYSGVATAGTRVYWPGNDVIYCFNAATNAMCSGGSWGSGAVSETKVYAVRSDPANPNCFWSNADTGSIKIRDGVTGALGCSSQSPIVRFPASVSVPRMACTANSGIQEWVDFRLPLSGSDSLSGKFSAARLSVFDPGGSVLPGWDSVLIPANGVLSLSGLPVSGGSGSSAWVAGGLEFRVLFENPSYTSTPKATLKAIGDAPQLCLRATTLAVCPSGSGALTGLSPSSMTVSASGSSTDASNSTTSLTPASASVAISAPTNSQCGATLTGTATATGTTVPIVNATVTLLDSSGSPVLDGQGAAITTTTGADGTYSFGYLFPGGYKVRFNDVGTRLISSTTVSSGGSGSTTDSTSATSLVSNMSTLAVGTNGVVNASYYTPTIATADTSTGVQGAVQTINVKANDTASSGANITSPTITFCSIDSPASGCTLTSKTVASQGTYTLSAGNVVFTPCSAANTPAGASCTGAFSGTATPVSYQITDSAGSSATSTITPTVVPPPTATADAQTGAWDTNQTFTPHQNDTAGAGSTLATSPAGICVNTTTAASSCTSTTLTVANQGTYTLNTTTGVVTFDPLPTFTGTATSIKYAATDALGQKVLSTITPTVQPPPPPTGNADTTTGKVGLAQTVTPFANDTVGASGITFTATSVKLCSSGQSAPNCTATSLVKAGEGTYSVNTTTGVVTFTPCSAANTPAGASCTGAFTGTATPVTYQVGTSFGDPASSTYTPKVVPLPTAVADVQTGAWDTNQTFTPTSNDSAGSGASLVAIPSGICLNSVTVASSCTSTSLTVSNQGTYTLNTSTGVVTFDPLPSFTGPATSIKYVVADSLGQQSLATITPTVTPPAAPTATPESKTVIPGGSVAFTTLTGVGGLASTGGPSFTTSATCLVDTSVTPNTCGASLTISGEGTWSVNTTTGVVTFAASQSVTSGTKTAVTYRVTDATGQTATSTLTPIVPPPPTVNPDSSVDEQNQTQVLSPLSNDSAAASTSLNASSLRLCPTNATAPFNATNCNLSSLSVPDVGKYTVNSDGTVTFVPCTTVTGVTCAGSYLGGSSIFTGSTSVRYVVADQVGQYGSSTLDVDVLPPPVVKPVNDTGSSPFATPVVFEPLTNDSGGTTTGLVGYTSTDTATLDSSTLKLCDTGQRAPSCNASSVTTPEGVYALNALTNRITFTPATNFVGTPVGSPLYMVCNQLGSGWSPMPSTTCATAKVTPTIQPPAVPSAVDDTQTGPYNTALVMSVLGNDTKDAALTIAASTVKLCATGQTAPNCTATSIQVTGEGTYSVNSTNGQVTFTPLPSFAGTATVAPTYQFTDSYGATASAVITPTITPPPAPTASPQTKTVLPGASVQFTNVIGASGLGGGTGLKSGTNGGPCLVDPADSVCKTSFTVTGEGDWSIDQSTGIPTFVADTAASSGNQTAISYRVTDAVGHTASALLTPVIPPPATLGADSGTGGLDSNQTFNVLTNDTAGTGTTLVATTVKLCDTGQASPNCVATSVTINGVGTYSVDASGVVTFDPDANFTGQATPITYQVSDSVGRTYATIITPTVTAIPPTAAPDTVILPVGGTRSFQSIHATGGLVTRNLGGTALDPTSVCIIDPDTTVCGTAPVVITGEGTYTLDATTGIVTYTADPNATLGAKTSITYKLSDIAGNTVQSTLTPTIVAPPTTTADASSGSRGARQVISVLGNDTPGANSAPLVPSTVRLCGPGDIAPNCTATTITITGQGTYTVDTTTGDIVFTPASTFTGDTTPVSYSVTDSLGQRRASSINITVQPDNTVPNGNGGSSSNGGSSNSNGGSSNSNGGILPTTGRNTSDHIGLVLVIVAIGIILTSAARRRIAFTN